MWVNIFSLQKVPSSRGIRNISLFVQKLLNEAVGCCYEQVIVFIYKASQPEDPITPFTTGNAGSGFTFEGDIYALACVSVAEEI